MQVHNKKDNRFDKQSSSRKVLAKAGEDLAAKYFASRGYDIVARNWRSGRFGEIDLVVCNRFGLLIFVEVKTRRRFRQSSGFSDSGFDAIDWRKQRKLILSANSFVARHATKAEYRIDALIIRLSDPPTGDVKDAEIIHVEGITG